MCTIDMFVVNNNHATIDVFVVNITIDVFVVNNNQATQFQVSTLLSVAYEQTLLTTNIADKPIQPVYKLY